PWFEFAPFLTNYVLGFDEQSWCTLMPYTTTGDVKKAARYRYCYEIRRTPNSYNDFTNVYSLVDAASSYSTANYEAGDWDTLGAQTGQNVYGYIGSLGTKLTLLMWDVETVFDDNGSWSPG